MKGLECTHGGACSTRLAVAAAAAVATMGRHRATVLARLCVVMMMRMRMRERGMREVLGQQRRREGSSECARWGTGCFSERRDTLSRALHTKDSIFNSAQRQRSDNTRGRDKEEE
jgi:hypothetical protein